MEDYTDQYDSAIEVEFNDDDDDDESTASLDDAFREIEYKYGRGYPMMYQSLHPWPIDMNEKDRQIHRFRVYKELFQGRLSHAPVHSPLKVLDIRTGTGSWAIEYADTYPSAMVYGIDIVCMQEEWLPPNCEFYIEDIMRLAWTNNYKNINLIHVGEIGGDPKLLQAILDGAFACCAPDGMIELWDCTLHLPDSQGISGLHRYAYKLREAYQRDGRDVDLASAYPEELEMHGFVHVVQHIYSIPLHPARTDYIQGEIIENWSAGFEASALELMHTHLGMDINEIFLECVAARAALREGVHGHLQIHVVRGRKPKLHGR